jgi:hypothetical protein
MTVNPLLAPLFLALFSPEVLGHDGNIRASKSYRQRQISYFLVV